jgi:hypothetical protein
MPGSAHDIGVGADGSVWAIGTNPTVGGYGIWRWNGMGAWQGMPGGGVRIDVDPRGNAWVVNDAGNVYRWTGSTWVQMPGGNAADIGIGANGSVFVVGLDGKVWHWNGQAWVLRDGIAHSISVGPHGHPWATSPDHRIWSATQK